MRLATWIIPDHAITNEALEVARQLDLPLSIAQVLTRKGLLEIEGVRSFLYPRLRDLSDPFDLDGMGRAVERIFAAIERNERIVLYGDYDVDGVTSVTLLYRVLNIFGATVSTFLPHRLDEGYGLSEEGVDRCLASHRPELFVALDCGTSSGDRIRSIESTGVNVIVIDHHEAKDRTPDCCAFVNPKTGSRGFEYLCTVGLVFKLCHAMMKMRRSPAIDLKKYLDLVALGTIADLAPLVEENRTLVYHGLRQMEQTEWIGLKALMEVAAVNTPIRPSDVGFRLGPRLNSAGRLGVAQDALNLLLADAREKALSLARELDWQNRDRQSVEKQTLDEASRQIATLFVPERDGAIVVGAKGWHPGVVGIVASRLMKLHYRPTIVIGFDETGDGKGSGRSVHGVSLVKALEECAEYLVQYGGHEMAAGIRLSFDRFETFAAAFQTVVIKQLAVELMQPKMEFDAEVSGDDLHLRFLEAHDLLQPFGIGNPQPLFLLRNVVPLGEPRILKEKHRLYRFRHGNCELTAIHFSSAQHTLPKPPWDIAFHIEANRYQGRLQLQIQVEALRSALKDEGC
jgi:single-stranded-DNA-specific exonuclease